MRRIFFFLILLVCQSTVLMSQSNDIYSGVLRELEANSPLFKLIEQQYEADNAEAFAGSLLDDPTLEIGHFWGSPSDKGVRWNLSVGQSFEMPSVYVHKTRLRQLHSRLASDVSHEAVRALRLEIKQLCADIVYYNAMVYIFEGRFQIANELSAIYTQRLASGDCSLLEYNRVQMDVAEAQVNLDKITAERDLLLATLRELNGGVDISLTEKYFPTRLVSDNYNDFVSSIGNRDVPNGALSKLHTQSVIDSVRVRESRSQWLPKMSVGYASEVLADEAFRGVVVGVSLPLWNNARKVRSSQLQADASKSDYEVALVRNQNQCMALFSKIRSSSRQVAALQSAFEHFNSVDLLSKAFEAGEIDLESYLLEIDYYNNAAMAIVEAQLDLESAVLRLEAIAF